MEFFIPRRGMVHLKFLIPSSVEKFEDLENDAIHHFDKLMSKYNDKSKDYLNDDHLFMMFVINIFTIHNTLHGGSSYFTILTLLRF